MILAIGNGGIYRETLAVRAEDRVGVIPAIVGDAVPWLRVIAVDWEAINFRSKRAEPTVA